MDPTQIDHHASYHSPLHPLRHFTAGIVFAFCLLASSFPHWEIVIGSWELGDKGRSLSLLVRDLDSGFLIHVK